MAIKPYKANPSGLDALLKIGATVLSAGAAAPALGAGGAAAAGTAGALASGANAAKTVSDVANTASNAGNFLSKASQFSQVLPDSPFKRALGAANSVQNDFVPFAKDPMGSLNAMKRRYF